MRKTLVKTVMAISLGMIITGCTSAAISGYQVGDNQTKIYCQQQVSVENWEIKAHIVTSGVVSDETIENVVNIIQTKVHPEAWNYLTNSGGKIVIVEGDDIRGYITENYVVDDSELEDDDTVLGYCPKFINDVGDLEKVDVVVASESISSLTHEFGHVLDYTHNYSDSVEFQKIYKRASSICEEIFNFSKSTALYDGDLIEYMTKIGKKSKYYSDDSQEFFAEMYSQYQNENLKGVDVELEAYLERVTQ